jgi:hypothetical protein
VGREHKEDRLPWPALPSSPNTRAAEADRKIADSINDKINESNPDDDYGSSGVPARVSQWHANGTTAP